MQCIKCGKKFRRTPPHKRRAGLRIRSNAKLCPVCWFEAMRNKPRRKPNIKS